MRYLATLIITILALSSFAQLVTVKEKPSFYLGQRGTIDVNILTQIGFTPMLASDLNYAEYEEVTSEQINLPHILINPQAEYTFALNNILAVYLRGALAVTSRDPVYMGSDNSSSSSLYESGTPKIRRRTFGFGFNVFLNNKAAIAPVGTNFSIGFSTHSVVADHSGMTLGTFSYNPYEFVELRDVDNEIVEFDYKSIDWGFQWKDLIGPKLYIQYGVAGSFNLGVKTGLIEGDYSYSEKTFKDRQLEAARESYMLRDLVMFKLGVGYVLH
ncbi:MAG: hypothetical protein HKP14_06765 [Bacteroidia bacterium]|nr:hypothetical protein [Bacteroidia bacterium]